jgi:LysR family transcriptional regulator, hydrogen peroxide-inducible genes activator
MNTRLLEYFVAVAQYKNFKRAADICGVSQPALSIQIKKLETQLASTLFERTTQQVIMTHAGLKLLDSAQHILSKVKELHQQGALLADPYSGNMHLGAFPTLAPSLFSRLVPELQKTYPNIYFHLIEEKTETLIKNLIDGQLDAAFLALPEEHPLLISTKLYHEEFDVALPTAHALNTPLELSDLTQENLLLLADGHCLREQALDFCTLSKLSANADFNASSINVLLHMVQLGNGITLVPANSRLDIKGVKYLPFKKKPPGRSIAMFWRKTSIRQDVLLEIADDIKREF